MNTLKNECLFLGRLGRDPELRYLPSGAGVVNFSIAVSMRKKGSDDTWGNQTTWVDLTAFGGDAERLVKTCKKGSLVLVKAEYRKRQFEHEGATRTAHEFIVREFEVTAGRREKDSSNEQEDPNVTDSGDGEFPF